MRSYVSSRELADQMERIYRDIPLDQVPWNVERAPDMLVEMVESGDLRPCATIDLGCGAGNYAVWLATKGFNVTGVDLSPSALAHARNLAGRTNVACEFLAVDLTGDVDVLASRFDFAYDWEVLHHVFPPQRPAYARNVHRLLRPGGRYLSVCFADADEQFGGTGKVRQTPLGTTLYFSSEEEQRLLLEPLFRLDELSTATIEGRRGPHTMIKVLATKRG